MEKETKNWGKERLALSIFRTWIKTYRWSATITLNADGGPKMQFVWTRTKADQETK